MKVIPAIDIMGGKVVRLIQGDAKRSKVYALTPLAFAKKWVSSGADMLHIVDLDGALEGRLINLEIIRSIAGNVKAKLELGGGIRDAETIRAVLDAGVEKAVIGTKALDNDFLSTIDKSTRGRIVIGIDAKDGVVYTGGWLDNSGIRAVDLAKEIEGLGFKTINYTDISRDGTLEGPNIKSLEELLKAVRINIIASGGVSGIDDIYKLKALEKDGLKGVIVGKALYEDKVDLKKAIEVCEG